ncbi:MAG: L-asparaginase 2 [Bacteroidales bacterium]
MKNLKRFAVIVVCMLSVVVVFAQKPNIHILATGGTIAGAGTSAVATNYTAGQVAIGTLLDAVPEIKDVANVTGEQIVRIGSQDMSNEVWLILAKRINKLLSSPECDGIVITHGTDTMEETAYFLNLTVHSDKPVVLVGSMRPSTSMSADGPLNLYNAVVVAASPLSKGHGVLVAMNGAIIGAHNVLKTNTISVQTFQAPNSGAMGYVQNGKVFYSLTPTKTHTTKSVFNVDKLNKLPKIGIVYGYSDIQADMVAPMLKNGYKGIIYAGVGNGNYHKNVFPELLKAEKNGIQVVRSSRVPTGPTTLDAEVDDAKYHFVASQELNPQKARILLMLALTKTNDWKQIQEYFMEY